MDHFHNEIISFCLKKATIKLASGVSGVLKRGLSLKPSLWTILDILQYVVIPPSTIFGRLQTI
jgi:hypothetical protein